MMESLSSSSGSSTRIFLLKRRMMAWSMVQGRLVEARKRMLPSRSVSSPSSCTSSSALHRLLASCSAPLPRSLIVIIINIPYGQSSAKLPVIRSLRHQVIRSSGLQVILSYCHSIILSYCHHYFQHCNEQ